ncbi:MAG: polyphosphate kinase 1 [Saprospiraceae bacterium]|nr:polyphosphate kinase 1 [Saprospiraceae bacterium]
MIPYIHRDISWLAFNYRVLQEAKDPNVPLFERLKFLAIYSSNLDEFFRVRVANHRSLLRTGKKTRTSLDFEPSEILTKILKIVNAQQEEFSKIFEKQIVPALKKTGIHILRRKRLNEDQIEFIETYFKDNMLPFVQPVLLVGDKIKPFLNTGSLYLALHLNDINDDKKKSQYAVVKIPSEHLPRFIELPSQEEGRHDIIVLDDIVRHNVRELFPGYDILDSYSIKLTRDAELYIDDEYSGDLISKIKKSLNKRNVGIASRMVYDRQVPKEMLEYLSQVFELSQYDKLPEGRYHNNADFFKLPNFGKEAYLDSPQPPLPIEELEEAESIFDKIYKKDYIVHVPYQSYNSVVKFFEDAANDPKVTHIKIIQYRVAKKSKIMDALRLAVKNGKQVTAFVEVKARFDEEANLIWGEKLEKAGVNVHYSMPGLKVHSKIAMVRRLEGEEGMLYTYLSTGNFHEDTAKIYSDIGIFTANPKLTSEAARVFNYLETKIRPTKPFKYFGVGQFNLKPMLIDLIKNEIKNAENGKPAKIVLKMNSIHDEEMIQYLYKASQKGVDVKMIIRGICSLVPGVKNVSTNIEAISIVDRYLEHARIFMFHNNGDTKIYLSSADWMVRNLHRRVETMFPILDKELQSVIIDLLTIQLMDNVKSRYIHYKDNNVYRKDTTDLPMRSQVETYYYMKRYMDKKNNKVTQP